MAKGMEPCLRATLGGMTLFVLRHAIAEDAAWGQPDPSRQLTDLGRLKARRVLAHARSIGVRPVSLLTSPYARAAQTATIAHEELRLQGAPLETSLLEPFVTVFDLWNGLREHASAGDLLIVGHNPQLSSLICWLIGARGDAVWLKKSGLAALNLGSAGPQPRAELAWLLVPRTVPGD